MNIKLGDKLLCRRTHYDIKGKHIWQIGKYYEIIGENTFMSQIKYHITSEKENTVGLSVTYNELNTFFLVDTKRIRRYKLNKIKNAGR